jgi:hypothetical protein
MKTSLCVALLGILVCAGPARADVVTDWNAITVTTMGQLAPASHARPGPSVILDFATVHAAMHDAIQAFDQRYESFASPISNAAGSPIAAAAQAAHDVLVARTLDQGAAFALNLDTLLNNYLGPLGLLADPGRLVGQEAASRVLAIRGTIGTFPYPAEVFTGGTGPGEWRPTPPAFAPMAAPWLRNVPPFTLKASDQLAGNPPPPRLGSGEYTHDYDEVKSLGRSNSTARTPEQTALALFYTDNFTTLWERTLRGVAAANTTNIGDSGRMFALANMAAADAIITAWTDKRGFAFWRPITAIQNGDTDGNPRTAGDASWTPYLVTPPYPDYTSGANNLTSSMTRVLEHLFGDKTEFAVFSTPANVTKIYERFSDMADDVVLVRILQGIHFRFADEVARREGKRAADWAVSHVLRPIN